MGVSVPFKVTQLMMPIKVCVDVGQSGALITKRGIQVPERQPQTILNSGSISLFITAIILPPHMLSPQYYGARSDTIVQ